MVNTFGDLRGAFAAAERINSVLSGAEIDDALAYALEKNLKRNKVHDKNIEALLVNGSNGTMRTRNTGYMSSLKSATHVRSLAQSCDICLEGMYFCVIGVFYDKVNLHNWRYTIFFCRCAFLLSIET